MAPPARAAVIGLDAVDPDIAVAMARHGDLPHLGALLPRSVAVPLRNPLGLIVGALWPSMATGQPAGVHGRYCYQQLRSGTYEVHRTTVDDVRAEPFWASLGRAGHRVAVVDVPHSRIVPDAGGAQLVDWGTHDRPQPFHTWPATLAADIAEQVGPHPLADDMCDVLAATGRLDELRHRLLAGIDRKADLCEHLLDEGGWDLFTVVFGEGHCAGHQFWHVHDPSHPRHRSQLNDALGDPMLDAYRALDAALGRVLTRLGDEVPVLVHLSHGMGPHYEATFMLHELLGRLDDALGARPAVVHRREQVLRRGSRTLRRAAHRLGRPVAMPVRWVDGARRFFPVPNNDVYGGVRVNLVGREPRGRVHPGPEQEQLVRDLERELSLLVNAETGRPLVRSVIRTADVHPGPALDALPDLLIDWDRTAPITAVASPTVGRVEKRYTFHRTGDHRISGLLLARGAGGGPGTTRDPADVTALAATACALISSDAPAGADPPIDLSAGRPVAVPG